MENKVEVINRNNGYTGYQIPDTGVTRSFAPGESKKISVEELKQLSYVPGGDYILENCLIIKDNAVLEDLNMAVEPEYFYTEKEIKDILYNGSMDQLEDTLNFAPEGVIDLIKDIAVKEEIPDVRKRDMISKKTGFNITSAINVNHIMNAEDEAPVEKENKVRKAAPVTSGRKAPAPAVDKYKVVTTKK